MLQTTHPPQSEEQEGIMRNGYLRIIALAALLIVCVTVACAVPDKNGDD